ncbi:MAG: hypothetical protein NZL92_05310 [Gloeomargarita sp. SKYG116]|nr:hypothetical protein [Gloeomargarita sp. SKYG116]MDW8401095.1 hypothetical protein [Gloeomargarita sp. SKYGB_i_bin116]
MPYQAGRNLPGERASKLGHLEVLRSPLVQQIVENFEQPEAVDMLDVAWESFPPCTEPLDVVFAVDGSWQPVTDERPPYKKIAFIKTALMMVDQAALNRIDKDEPHPLALRDLMAKAAVYHATAFPLRHVYLRGLSVYDATRQIIFESLKDDSLQGEVMETLKWLAYEKWSKSPRSSLPDFQCPHSEIDGEAHNATLSFDQEEGVCQTCGKKVFITDMLGFHLEMSENAASESVATAYMNIHETLLLFTGIRHFWESNKRETLKRCLFLKDGPLQIRAQYSKLVNPIRNFLLHAYLQGYPISIVGQEKTGIFVDHLNLLLGKNAPSNHFFIPDHVYICEQIQSRPPSGAPYGKDTNYGAKVFIVMNERCRLVLSIPICIPMDKFIQSPDSSKIINFDRILATLPAMLSSRHENALIPIELANSIASLSTYPSVKVLELFAFKSRE